MKPLATIVRPKNLEEYIGQEKLVGENSPIKKMIESGELHSMVFWGPPACGKTTLAKIISQSVDADFYELSAVMDGKAKLKEIIEKIESNDLYQKQAVLFIDEIHRWSKSQQDALLPYVESGLITLIGATTENPSFTIISALLSRSRVYVFEPHNTEDLLNGLGRGVEYLSKNHGKQEVEEGVLESIAQKSNYDLRFALNSLQVAWSMTDSGIKLSDVDSAMQNFLRYDRSGEEHYNIISALHKSMRASNPTAAVYWATRMLAAGEDPLYIARRMVRFASEDVGNAAPNALLLANQVFDTCQKIGMPECGVALAQLAEYLSTCPKNNSAYVAYKMAMSDVEQYGNLPVPMHLRNAPTDLMKDMGYGEGYQYDHDVEDKKSNQQCMPDKLKDTKYFRLKGE